MGKLKSIMVVMPSRQQMSPAVHRAMAYARRTETVLYLQLFDHYAPIDYSESIFGAEVAERARRDYIEERMRWLTQQAAGLADQGLRVECDVVWAPRPHEAIIGRILGLEPDVVLKDVDCEPDSGALRLAAVDWKLLRLNPAPVMLVHPQSKLLPHHVLAAVDVTVAGGEAALNDEIVDAARLFSALSGAEMDIVSVFSYNPLKPYGTGFIAESYELMDSAHKQALERFAARQKIAAAHVKRVCTLDAGGGIAEYAKKSGSDLVVLGCAYHGGLERLLFGTTAEALLRRLTCDALLVKPSGYLAELAKHLDLEALKTKYAAGIVETS
ncbi:MAG: universal stress protein [Gammaproteobacteria bacterium]|nr:universal stress protein [Gammaproteobacteria bacterium]